VRREYRPVEGGLAGEALVMAYRAADGGAVLYFVADGRLGRRVPLPADAIAGDAGDAGDALVAAVKETLGRPAAPGDEVEAAPADPVAAPLDADQVNILMRWIYRRVGRPECVAAGADTPATQLADAIRGALRRDTGADFGDLQAGPPMEPGPIGEPAD
jgi:hypothetical protein